LVRRRHACDPIGGGTGRLTAGLPSDMALARILH
jgi:hypothetical protein